MVWFKTTKILSSCIQNHLSRW